MITNYEDYKKAYLQEEVLADENTGRTDKRIGKLRVYIRDLRSEEAPTAVTLRDCCVGDISDLISSELASRADRLDSNSMIEIYFTGPKSGNS